MFSCAKRLTAPARPAIAVSARNPLQRLAKGGTPTYLIAMQTRSIFGTLALVVPLVAILVAAGWFAASAWVSVEGPPMPAIGYLAMALGVVFSLIVGCGLMALLFYSNRHGYDDPFQAADDRE